MALRFKSVPNLPFAPIAAAIFGLGAAAFVFAIPVYYVERAADMSGLASVLPAARAPLGNTAQGLIALAMAFGTFVVMWMILRPVEKLFKRRKDERKERSFRFGRKQPGSMPDPDDVPLTAAETASQYAPTRKPIFAQAELGAPLMSDAALASGGELLAEAPVVQSSIFDEEQPLDLTAMMAAPVFAAPPVVVSPVVVSVADPMPAPMPAPVATAIEWLTPDQVSDEIDAQEEAVPVAIPAPALQEAPAELAEEHTEEPKEEPAQVSIEEPTLRELLVRFEAALKKRREMEATAQQPASPFPDAALSSLRNLMAANRVR